MSSNMNNKLDYKVQGTPPQTSANKERFSDLVFGLNTLLKLITFPLETLKTASPLSLQLQLIKELISHADSQTGEFQIKHTGK